MFIFDSSTLILIAKIELLQVLLADLKMQVAIPRAVWFECCDSKKTLDSLMIQKAVDGSKIIVKPVKNRKLVLKLEDDFNIAKGEAESIALALQESAALVAIDDKRGINACKLSGVEFTTAVDILVQSRRKGLIDLRDALAKLSALSEYGRYTVEILKDARKRLEQNS